MIIGAIISLCQASVSLTELLLWAEWRLIVIESEIKGYKWNGVFPAWGHLEDWDCNQDGRGWRRCRVYCGRLMKKWGLDIAKVRLMASAREETKGRVRIQIDGWDDWKWGGGGISRVREGETGKAGIGEAASLLAAMQTWLWGPKRSIVWPSWRLVAAFVDVSNLSQTACRGHTQTLQSTLYCHMRLFPSLLTSAAAGQFGLHQNLIKFYCAVKRFGTAPWIILPDPNTVAQFRLVIKKSLNVIKPAWQQGKK